MGDSQTPQILQGLQDAAVIPTPAAPKYDSGAPVVPAAPAVAVPLRPADQAPEAPTDKELGIHPVDNMAMAFMSHLISKENGPSQPPSEAPAPGSFGSKLSGALSSVAAGLGDMRTGGDPGQGHGWLSAVGATLNARQQRKTEEQKTSFEQQERLKNDQINLANANANLRQHALTVHKLDKENRDIDAASGELFMSHLRAGSELSKGQTDSFNVQDNISNDQLKDMAKDPKFLQTHTARITGYEPVLGADGQPRKDADGFTIESPLYSVADIAVGDKSKVLTVTPELAKKWNDAGLKQVTAGTILPATVANGLDVQAQRYGTTLSILNHDKVQPLPNDVKDQMVTALQDPNVQHAVAMQPGNPLAGLYDAADNMSHHIEATKTAIAAAQAKGDQNAVAALTKDLQDHQDIQQKLDQTINSGFTPQERAAYQKQVEADRKQTEVEQQNVARDAETARHNRAEEDIKRLEASGGAPEVLDTIGGKLSDAEMVPSQLPKRAKNYDATWVAADNQSWNKYGKPYNGAQAEAEYAYYKRPQTQDTLKYLNSLTGGPGVVGGGNLGELVAKSNQINRTEFPPLNDVAAWARLKTGDPLMAQYQTVLTEVADQVAKILQGGTGGSGTSDVKLKQAQELFAKGFTKDQITGIAKELGPLLVNRRQGMIGKNRFLQKDYYGTGGMTTTMIAPDGKSYGEVPLSKVDAAKAKGGRVANKQDYTNLNISTADH